MYEYLMDWLNQAIIYKIITAIVSILVIVVVSRFIKTSITRYVESIDIRYSLRKFITFASYILAVLLLTIIFSDRLGNLTVALGVAGAGVAFALQEVIASLPVGLQ